MSIFDNQIIHRHYLTSQSSIVFWQVNHSLCSDKSIIQCLFLTSQSSIVYFWQINIPSFNSDKQTIFIVMIWQASHPLSSDKSIIHRIFLKSQSSIFYFWQDNHPSSLSYKSIIHCRWQVNHPVFIPDKSIFHCVLISQSHIVFWEIIHLSSIFFFYKLTSHCDLISQSIIVFWQVNHPLSISDKSIFRQVAWYFFFRSYFDNFFATRVNYLDYAYCIVTFLQTSGKCLQLARIINKNCQWN